MRKETDSSGTIRYYSDLNQLHREDGPAIEFADGKKEYWILGIQYKTKKDYLQRLKLKAFW